MKYCVGCSVKLAPGEPAKNEITVCTGCAPRLGRIRAVVSIIAEIMREEARDPDVRRALDKLAAEYRGAAA